MRLAAGKTSSVVIPEKDRKTVLNLQIILRLNSASAVYQKAIQLLAEKYADKLIKIEAIQNE